MRSGRKYLALFLVVFLIFALNTSVFAKDKVVKWKVQGYVPAGMLFHETLERLAAEVERLSQGRFVWEVYPVGALVPSNDGLDAVSQGIYDADYSYSARWVGKIPASPLFCAVPGGFNVIGQQMWLEHGGGMELYQEMYDKYGYNVKVFATSPLPMEDYQWAKKPLKTLGDFKGLKMRMMPLMGDVLNENGLSVVFVPAGEIMPNLQRGVLDTAEYSTAAFDKTMGLWEVCKYVMLPGIHQPTSTKELLVNKKSYNALPDDLKLILESAVTNMRLKNWLWMTSKDLEAIEFYKDKGVEIVKMDDETVSTMIKWAEEHMEKLAAKDEFFKKVRESQKAFAKKWYPYEGLYRLPH